LIIGRKVPVLTIVTGGIPIKRLNGELCPYNFNQPRSGKPQLTERGYRLTGIPYIKA
jgi:hypothetical protein